MKLITLIAAAVTVFLSTVALGQTEVPNDFQAGTPARAAEVNDNFSTLESAVNQNASDIANSTSEINSNTELIQANTEAISANGQGIQVLAAGTSIGLFVEFARSRPGIEGFRTLSNTGYLFDVIAAIDAAELGAGDPPPPSTAGDLFFDLVWFEFAGCTGQAYTNAHPSGRIYTLESLQGFVFRSIDPTDPVQTYYVPTGSLVVDLIVSYRRTYEGGCVFVGTPTNRFVPVFPNDPVVTGVPNGSFAEPILLGH